MPSLGDSQKFPNIMQMRVSQFVTAARMRPDPYVDATIRSLLDELAQWRLLERMTPFDRLHHLRVYGLLQERGHQAPDLLRAALLHDVGKADERGRVMLGHRVVRVLGRAAAPSTLERVARPTGSRISHGLYLAEHHARLGAELVRATGASSRCCELIARHEDEDPSDDPELVALVLADAEAHR